MKIIIGQTDRRCKHGINYKVYEVESLQDGKRLYRSISKATGNCFTLITTEYPLIGKCSGKVVNLKDIKED